MTISEHTARSITPEHNPWASLGVAEQQIKTNKQKECWVWTKHKISTKKDHWYHRISIRPNQTLPGVSLEAPSTNGVAPVIPSTQLLHWTTKTHCVRLPRRTTLDLLTDLNALKVLYFLQNANCTIIAEEKRLRSRRQDQEKLYEKNLNVISKRLLKMVSFCFLPFKFP